jgi:hypothetical protein
MAVLDPFMGSGTTAIEAAPVATEVFGVEIDPYARLIATASTTRLSDKSISRLESVVKGALSGAPKTDGDTTLRPRLNNVEYWFEPEQFENLLRLKTYLIRSDLQEAELNLLLAAFGDIIRACSKAERQSLKPYISSKYVKVTRPVFAEFHKVASKYLSAIAANAKNRAEAIQWAGNDATDFQIEDGVDLAITSPPYINAMDYTRCVKLESAWIGTADDQSLRTVKAAQLGEASRRHGAFDEDVLALCHECFGELQDRDPVRFQTAVAFFVDMKRNLISVRRSLKADGTYFLIIGNSRIRGLEIPTHELIAKIGITVGFNWSNYFRYRIRDHRTSIPRGDRGGKIDIEHVIGLTAQ